MAFTLNIENQPDENTRLLACVTGLFIALVWLWVNWAGRKLQRLWRGIVQDFEKEIFTKGEGQIKDPFERAREVEGKRHSTSITLVLMLLSVGFIILWRVLLFRLFI